MVLGVFSIPLGNKESNEAALIAAIKALELSSYRQDFVGRYFVIEPDSADAGRRFSSCFNDKLGYSYEHF